MKKPLFLLLLFLLLFLNFFCCGHVTKVTKKKTVPVHWIVLHYHKTGNYLSTTLTKPFEAKNISVFVDHIHKRKTFVPSFFLESSSNRATTARRKGSSGSDHHYPIIISRAGNFLFDWNKELLHSQEIQYKVAHMVRDPYDMILSALLYHSQDNMPEAWLGRHLNPCVSNKQDILQFLETISRHPCAPNLYILQQYVRDITATCQRLYHQYSTISYHHTLRSLIRQGKIVESLQMEASRSILSGDICGADVLRMAANAVNENNANLRNTQARHFRRFWLSKFPLNEQKTFMQEAKQFFNFLTQATGEDKVSFWHNVIGLSEYIILLQQDAVWHLPSLTNTSVVSGLSAETSSTDNIQKITLQKLRQKSQHITQNMLPNDSREQYLRDFRNSSDDSFVLILNLVSEILHYDHISGGGNCNSGKRN